MIEVLKQKQKDFESKGISVVVTESPFTIVVVTPIMRRVHEQAFSGEIVFVDSSGSCDQMSTNITLMFCSSKVRALPLACILHDSQTMDCYNAAFIRAR